MRTQYENGVLTVSTPKVERARPREIRVNSSASGASQLKTTGPSSEDKTTEGQTTGNGGEQAGSSRRQKAQGPRSGAEEGSRRR
jgi:hypothetical protein